MVWIIKILQLLRLGFIFKTGKDPVDIVEEQVDKALTPYLGKLVAAESAFSQLESIYNQVTGASENHSANTPTEIKSVDDVKARLESIAAKSGDYTKVLTDHFESNGSGSTQQVVDMLKQFHTISIILK